MFTDLQFGRRASPLELFLVDELYELSATLAILRYPNQLAAGMLGGRTDVVLCRIVEPKCHDTYQFKGQELPRGNRLSQLGLDLC